MEESWTNALLTWGAGEFIFPQCQIRRQKGTFSLYLTCTFPWKLSFRPWEAVLAIIRVTLITVCTRSPTLTKCHHSCDTGKAEVLRYYLGTGLIPYK